MYVRYTYTHTLLLRIIIIIMCAPCIYLLLVAIAHHAMLRMRSLLEDQAYAPKKRFLPMHANSNFRR